MMRLTTMWKVDSTIRADGSGPVAERLLERWEHDRGSVRFFRSSANFLYAFRREGSRHFLRFADSTERSRGGIEAEIELLAWLAAQGVTVAEAVPSARGDLVETVETPWGTFHAVVFPALEGEQREIEDLDPSEFRRWGAALGQLHSALDSYPMAGSAAWPAWEDHLDLARERVSEDAPALRDELEEIASALAALPVSGGAYGLIHYDFELDNLVFRDDSVGILDFDDCSRLWRAADIVFALGDLFGEGSDLDDERVRAFVGAYSGHHALDPDLAARAPLLLRMGDLVRYARLARAADLAVGPEHPAWLGELSRKLHDRMAAYRSAVGRCRR
jgi:Ser/Thr protein kinase RdoA (MazF antagonist)